MFCGSVNPFLVSNVRSGRGKDFIGKPSGGRNLIERSRGASYSSLHTLKSTEWEGIA